MSSPIQRKGTSEFIDSSCLLLVIFSLCFPTKEKEKLYVELKHILAKQPGPEVAEQLYHCQKTLQEQTKKLKVLHFISLVVVLLFLMLFFPFGSVKLDECCILSRQICVSPNETLLLQLSSRKKGILKFVTVNFSIKLNKNTCCFKYLYILFV